jgi:glycosyltransferase involved in cell wall biosynthesis
VDSARLLAKTLGPEERGWRVESGTESIAILMGCRDGARFLPEQLASIAAQTHANWRLVASDDGSGDATRAILAAFRAEHGPERVEIREGPRAGFAANYLGMAGDPAIRADYYAFADQDDVWHPDRLARGLARLRGLAPGVPGLTGGRTVLIDAAGRETGRSLRFRAAPGFANALVQSIAGGNTMLFNTAAKALLERVRPAAVIAHDWWIYILVSGAGGTVIYDPEPSVRYRQHGANLIGGNQGPRARLARLRMLAGGTLAHYSDVNLAALEAAWPVLTAEARATTALMRRGRRLPLPSRLACLPRIGLYRQTAGGTLTLWLAFALGRL